MCPSERTRDERLSHDRERVRHDHPLDPRSGRPDIPHRRWGFPPAGEVGVPTVYNGAPWAYVTTATDEAGDLTSIATRPLMTATGLSKRFGDLDVIRDISSTCIRAKCSDSPARAARASRSWPPSWPAFSCLTRARHFDGDRLAWPFAAQALGIEIITQRPELVETMDITSNIFLGHEADGRGAGDGSACPIARAWTRRPPASSKSSACR